MNRTYFLRIYYGLLATFLLFWWPLSHWFYPDWYHNLLGFEEYDYALVKIIGTIGMIPVFALFFSIREPIKNRAVPITIILFSILMSLTYHFLITTVDFPPREYINVALLCVNAVILILSFPWKRESQNE